MRLAQRQIIPPGRYAYIFNTENDRCVLLIYHASSGFPFAEMPFSGDCRTTEFDAFMLTLALNVYFGACDVTELTEDIRRLNAYLEFRTHYRGTFVFASQNATGSVCRIISETSNECFLKLAGNSSLQCESSDLASIACLAMNQLIDITEKTIAKQEA